MTEAEKIWCSLTCLPKPGAETRAQLEDELYLSGCEGIWDHLLDDCGAEALIEVELKGHFTSSGAAYLTAYFPDNLQLHLSELSLKLEALELVSETPRIETVKNEDWLENWRQNFTITELTEKTLVVPAWRELPVSERRLGLRIYPGLGFGTGTHETTRLAAVLLENELTRAAKPVSVLDVGTGSAILAILAAKRGAKRILALDIDEDALLNARENCHHNLVTEQIVLSSTPVTALNEKFQLIVANIIAPVLRQLAPEFSRLIKPGGRLILSGILVEQLAEVTKVYSELGFVIKESQTAGEWAACTCELS